MEFAHKSEFELLVARVAELEKMALPVVAVVAKKAAAKPAAAKPAVAKPAVAKPAVAGGEEPEASSYRLTETDA